MSTEAANDRLSEVNGEENDENALSPSVYFPHLEKLNKYLFQRPGSRAFSVPAFFPFFTSNKVVIGKSAKKNGKQRPPTASIESTNDSNEK